MKNEFTKRKIAKLSRLIRTRSEGGFPNWICWATGEGGGGELAFWWCFVTFPLPPRVTTHWENPHIKSDVKRQERGVVSRNPWYVRKLLITSKKKKKISLWESYHIVKAEFFLPFSSKHRPQVPISHLSWKIQIQKAPPYNSKWTKFRSCFLCLSACWDI